MSRSTDWELRPVPAELGVRYLAEGAWDDRTLGQFLDEALTSSADLEIRIFSDSRPYVGTMGEVHRLARRLAAGLRRAGVEPGDVVAFQLPNWLEAAVTFYAATMLGVVLVPIVHFYGPKEVGFILRQARARTFIVVEGFGTRTHRADLETVRADLPDLERIVVVPTDPSGPVSPVAGDLSFDSLIDDTELEGPVPVDPDSPAVIGYTSGTTSSPKGVIHSHRTLGFEVRQLTAHQEERVRANVTGAPIGHAIGMLAGLLIPPYRGFPIYLMDVWSPPRVLEIMDEFDISAGTGSTFFLTSLLDDPGFGPRHLARMGMVGLGGSPVPAAVADRADRLGISLVRSYGATEHPSVTGSKHSDHPDKRRYTDGRTLPFVEIRTVDEQGRDTAAGEPGEILTRGPDRFVGYTDPSLNDAAIDPDGWFHTGDVGVIDPDGYLTITDRLKDIIIRGGENVSAAEVEECLATMAEVAEVAVVAAPDARLGEHGCAFFRMRAGAPVPTMEEMRGHLEAAGLARQKWPEELRSLDELPRTPSGKVQKYVLRQQLGGTR